jgi:hypothetical protein
MNRPRSAAPKTPLSVFITLGVAAAVATTGGIMHAVCKNHQVLTERKIVASEKRMKEARGAIMTADIGIDKLADRYELKERLRANGSTMVPLGHGDIVEVTPGSSVPTVASTNQP